MGEIVEECDREDGLLLNLLGILAGNLSHLQQENYAGWMFLEGRHQVGEGCYPVKGPRRYRLRNKTMTMFEASKSNEKQVIKQQMPQQDVLPQALHSEHDTFLRPSTADS